MEAVATSCLDFFKCRVILILWISLAVYIFNDTFIFYKTGRQFYQLRSILGLGLCISRGTAAVINLCSAIILLPLCKKLNKVLYRLLAKLWPGLFFFWLENAKSAHMTVGITLLVFAVVHSISHFVNIWNFSRRYDENNFQINVATYRDESPLLLLFSTTGLTGITMLMIIMAMGVTSMRIIRRKTYNVFWFTHQLYGLFLCLLIIHPLSGILKEEVLDTHGGDSSNPNDFVSPKYVPIKSKTWLWMVVPLSGFFIDILWRIFSRNRTRVQILNVTHLPGRVMCLTLSCDDQFSCEMGQYVLLQCLDISLLEWHPFTVVKLPTSSQREFEVWIRVKGDWTESLEKMLLEKSSSEISVLVDGPFSSPMEWISRSELAICVAAGIGITPFVSVLHEIFINPRNKFPGRIHLIWIVRDEQEISWLADLAEKTINKLRYSNQPDRLHLEFYVTNSENNKKTCSHFVLVNEKGDLSHKIRKDTLKDDERATLLTPNLKRHAGIIMSNKLPSVVDNRFDLAKQYPILKCRVRKGRPHWDIVFGYWVNLYPHSHLKVFCCGPKKLVKLLRNRCLWPNDEWPKYYLILYKFYEISLHLLTIILFIISAIGTSKLTDNTMLFLINLDKCLVGYFFFIKSILFIRLRKRFKFLITEIMYTGDKISESRVKLMATHVKAIAGLSLSLCGLFSLVSLYNGEMTFEAWMPFDPKKNKMNLYTSAQIVALTFLPNLCRSVGVQGIVCSVIMYICDQLVELQNRIKALRYTPDTVKEMSEEFNEIVKKHVRLIRHTKYLSDLFSDYFFIQNGGITIELCLNALMVSIIKQKGTAVNFLVLLAIALLNAYIYCYLGDRLISDSQGIALAAYETQWTQWPIAMQKKLLIVIIAAQKPLSISAGGMATMSIQTFSQLLYNGYSVFAVLNDAVD